MILPHRKPNENFYRIIQLDGKKEIVAARTNKDAVRRYATHVGGYSCDMGFGYPVVRSCRRIRNAI